MPDETKAALSEDTQDAAPEKDTTAQEPSEDERMKAAGWRKVRGAWRR